MPAGTPYPQGSDGLKSLREKLSTIPQDSLFKMPAG